MFVNFFFARFLRGQWERIWKSAREKGQRRPPPSFFVIQSITTRQNSPKERNRETRKQINLIPPPFLGHRHQPLMVRRERQPAQRHGWESTSGYYIIKIMKTRLQPIQNKSVCCPMAKTSRCHFRLDHSKCSGSQVTRISGFDSRQSHISSKFLSPPSL